MSEDRRSRPGFFSQIDVTHGPCVPSPSSGGGGAAEIVALLRELLAAQDRQNELLEELAQPAQRRPAAAGQRARTMEAGQSAAGPQLPRGRRGPGKGADRVPGEPDAGDQRQLRVAPRRRVHAQRVRRSLWAAAGPSQRPVAGPLPIERVAQPDQRSEHAVTRFRGSATSAAGRCSCSPRSAAGGRTRSFPADSRHSGRPPETRSAGRNGGAPAPAALPPAEAPPSASTASGGYRWKIEVPGEGNSSPIVWGDCVLLTTALAETDPPTLAILCFDRRDGRLVWQKEAGQAQGRTHNKNGYASATLATDGERIVAFFGSTGLFCYDSPGKLLWHADLGDLDHQWGHRVEPRDLRRPGHPVVRRRKRLLDRGLRQADRKAGVAHASGPAAAAGPRRWSSRRTRAAKKRTELIVNGTDGKDADGRLVLALRSARRPGAVAASAAPPHSSRRRPIVGQRSGLQHQRPQRPDHRHPARRKRRRDRHARRLETQPRRAIHPHGAHVSGPALHPLRQRAGHLLPSRRRRGDLDQAAARGTFSASLVAADGRIYASLGAGRSSTSFAAADEFELSGRERPAESASWPPPPSPAESCSSAPRAIYTVFLARDEQR